MTTGIFKAEKLAGTLNVLAFSGGDFSEGVSAARDFMKMVLENSDTVEISPLETTAQFARYEGLENRANSPSMMGGRNTFGGSNPSTLTKKQVGGQF